MTEAEIAANGRGLLPNGAQDTDFGLFVANLIAEPSRALESFGAANGPLSESLEWRAEVSWARFWDYPYEECMTRTLRSNKAASRAFRTFYGRYEAEIGLRHQLLEESYVSGHLIDSATYEAGREPSVPISEERRLEFKAFDDKMPIQGV